MRQLSDREWCAWVTRRLARTISSEAPEGIGRTQAAWDAVDAPSAELIEELQRVAKGQGSRETATELATQLRAAWNRAGIRHRAAQEAAA